MPPHFKDFSNTVTDILNDDFGDKKSLKIKHTTPDVQGNGIGVTSELLLSSYFGKLSAKWKHASGFSLDKLSFDNKGVKYEASMSKLSEGLVVKATGDVNASKPLSTIEAEYTQPTVAASLKTDIGFDQTVASAVLGQEGIQVGGSVIFKRKSGVEDYPLAIGYGDSKYFASVSAEDKLRKFGLAARYNVCDKLSLALFGLSGLEFSKGSPNQLELGASYKWNNFTTAKAKYAFVDGQKRGNNAGSLEATVNSTPLRKVNLVCGVAIPVSGVADVNSYKYGAGITLG
jgi:hypothetical protein